MALFDRFQKKWKHPDPVVRRAAVRSLKDQELLGEIAGTDSDAEVCAAALQAIEEPSVLEQLALGDLACAASAAARVTEPVRLARLAQKATQPAVRQCAIERLKDSNLLQRISALDPDATVRALARIRAGGPDPACSYLKATLSKLSVSTREDAAAPEFTGTLDEVCQALIRDPRFFVNGEVVEEEANVTASVADPTQAPWSPSADVTQRTTIRFLAQPRARPATDTSAEEDSSFYHIKVWRTGADRYDAVATNKRTAPTSDPFAWSQASGSGAHS